MTEPSAISIDDKLGNAFDGLPAPGLEERLREPQTTIQRLRTQLVAYENAFLEHPVPVVVYFEPDTADSSGKSKRSRTLWLRPERDLLAESVGPFRNGSRFQSNWIG